MAHSYAMSAEQRTHALAGDISGEYIATEQHEYGTLVLAPNTSADAILGRLGHTRGSLEDLEAQHGRVQPPDGEG